MKAKKAGYKIIQVKINGDPVEAAEKIAEARALLCQNETLLIDANTGKAYSHSEFFSECDCVFESN